MQKTQIWSLGWKDPLEEGMATHSSILAWIIPVDRRAWQTTVRRVAKSWTQLNATWHACSHTKNRRYIRTLIAVQIQEWVGFPGGTSGKEPDCQCRRHKRCRFNHWVGRSARGGHGNLLQYSFLENPMDRGAWWATVQRVTKSWTWLMQLSTLACRQGWRQRRFKNVRENGNTNSPGLRNSRL